MPPRISHASPVCFGGGGPAQFMRGCQHELRPADRVHRRAKSSLRMLLPRCSPQFRPRRDQSIGLFRLQRSFAHRLQNLHQRFVASTFAPGLRRAFRMRSRCATFVAMLLARRRSVSSALPRLFHRALDDLTDAPAQLREFVADIMRNFLIEVRDCAFHFAQRIADAARDIMRDTAGELAALRNDAPGCADNLADELRNFLPQILREVLKRRREAPPETEITRAAASIIGSRMRVVTEQNNVGVGGLEADIETTCAETSLDVIASTATETLSGNTIQPHSPIARSRAELRRVLRRNLHAATA